MAFGRMKQWGKHPTCWTETQPKERKKKGKRSAYQYWSSKEGDCWGKRQKEGTGGKIKNRVTYEGKTADQKKEMGVGGGLI